MRVKSQMGVKKSAEIISMNYEDQIFRDGILGDENPMQLLCAIICMMGLYLALKGVLSIIGFG